MNSNYVSTISNKYTQNTIISVTSILDKTFCSVDLMPSKLLSFISIGLKSVFMFTMESSSPPSSSQIPATKPASRPSLP
jgi:hypothetical protein